MSSIPVDIDGILVAATRALPLAFSAELREIHAAAVELIEADKEYDVAKAEATPPHSCAEPSDEALKRLMIAEERRAAALARIQGVEL